MGLDFTPRVLQPPPEQQQPDGAARTPEELRDVQVEVLRRQVALADELDLPLNVHSRSAGHYAVDALIAGGARRALLHAFDGRLQHALRGAAAGFCFSVPPSVVRSPHMQGLVAGLPLDSLVLETDAPALPPERGGRNAPANLAVSAAEVARIKGLSRNEVVAATTANALRLFGPRAAAALAASELRSGVDGA